MVLVMMMYAILRHNCVMKVDSLEGFGGSWCIYQTLQACRALIRKKEALTPRWSDYLMLYPSEACSCGGQLQTRA